MNNMNIYPMITDSIEQIYQEKPYDIEDWTLFCLQWLYEITFSIDNLDLAGLILYKINDTFLLFFFKRTDWPTIERILIENKLNYTVEETELEKIIKFNQE